MEIKDGGAGDGTVTELDLGGGRGWNEDGGGWCLSLFVFCG